MPDEQKPDLKLAPSSAEEQAAFDAKMADMQKNLVPLLKEDVLVGFPARLKRFAKLISDSHDELALGQWLEHAHMVAHNATVLAAYSPEAEEFRDGYKPKLAGDAGIDMTVIKDAVLNPGEYVDLPSGVRIAMPSDWFAEVRARSSTSKRLVHVFPGVIDPGFTGELMACVINLGKEPITIKRGDRVAQLIFHKRLTPNFLAFQAEDLPKTERGDRGFGSTNEVKS